MAALEQPAMESGSVARTDGAHQHCVGDAVQLDEDDAGHVGDVGAVDALAGLSGDALVDPRCVVDGEQATDGRAHDHKPYDDRQSRPEAVDLDAWKEVEHP